SKRERTFMAALCSAQLRLFADQCASVAYDDGTCRGEFAGGSDREQSYREAQVSPPDPPDWPSELRWDALDGEQLRRLFSIPVAYRRMRGALADVSDNDFPPFDDFFAYRQGSYAVMALNVMAIAQALEKSAGIAVEDPD